MCTQCYKRYATRSRNRASAFVHMSAHRLSAVRNSFLIQGVRL